eukprot:scaffold81902_cov67-Phaeocystis_antarctica.AAC.6
MITVTARARARSAMRTITPSASVGASTATHDLTADHSCCGRRGPATVPGSGSAPAGDTSSIQPRDLTCMHMHMHMHTQAAQFIAAKSCAARTHAPGYLYRATSSSKKPVGGKLLVWRAATPRGAARRLLRRLVGLWAALRCAWARRGPSAKDGRADGAPLSCRCGAPSYETRGTRRSVPSSKAASGDMCPSPSSPSSLLAKLRPTPRGGRASSAARARARKASTLSPSVHPGRTQRRRTKPEGAPHLCSGSSPRAECASRRGGGGWVVVAKRGKGRKRCGASAFWAPPVSVEVFTGGEASRRRNRATRPVSRHVCQ